MKAMIFAAGLGTRLKPLTDYMPKALVRLGERPLLQIVLDKLHKAGFNDCVVNVHHFAEQIIDYLAGTNVKISDERDGLLETGGGIKHASNLLNDAPRFLIHNVDILSNVDLLAFWEAGEQGEATLLVSDRKTQRYLLFDDDMRLVGWINIATGEVRSPYEGLDPAKYRMFAFAGIHQMYSSLLPLMDEWPEKFGIIDFYLKICATKPIYGYVQEGLKLMDVGKLNTLSEAEKFLQEVEGV